MDKKCEHRVKVFTVPKGMTFTEIQNKIFAQARAFLIECYKCRKVYWNKDVEEES